MTRRDTIIIAVLVNIGLLAVLFMMAVSFDEESVPSPAALAPQETYADATLPEVPVIASQVKSGDEIDQVLQVYSSQETAHGGEAIPLTTSVVSAHEAPAPTVEPVTAVSSEPQYVEVVVKKGDFLDKIARANSTTVEKIMKASGITSDRLSIGQVLRVPVKTGGETTAAAPKTPKTTTTTAKVASGSDAQYYTVKRGDNPWKIARQFKVEFHDLLKLNGLNEEKARNLKVGDKIRVH